MITQGQKDIITDFFAHTVNYNSVRGMEITRDIPDLGKVVSIEADEENILLGTITIRELGTFEISDLLDSELLVLISFIQELDVLRRCVQEACQLALPDNSDITVCFDWETNKKTRFLFINNCPKCDYGQHYKIIRSALTALGYVVKKDPTDSSVAYIIKYKATYLAKSRFGKLLYNISHFGGCVKDYLSCSHFPYLEGVFLFCTCLPQAGLGAIVILDLILGLSFQHDLLLLHFSILSLFFHSDPVKM